MDGFIALHRKMLDWEWYTDANVMRVFLHCLLKANYDTRNWRGITIERGQFITSITTLASELELSAMQIRIALDKLQRTSEITISTTNKYSVISVCNYESYQDINNPEQHATQHAKGQANNKQTTSKQQQHNNNNNITNKQYITKSTTDVVPKDEPSKKRFVKPTIEEIQAYCTERGNGISAERFFAYYEANGWRVGRNPMKDWRAAVRTWEQQDGGRVKRQQRESTEQEERARFEAQMEIERKKDVERRRAAEEQEIEEYRQKELKRINDIIYGNNENNDNNK